MTILEISQIRTDGGTQSREELNQDVIRDYTESMLADAQFPPVIVFYDGTVYWLADGFHRIEAAKQAGGREFDADVRQGTRRDAVLFSCGANGDHGLRRTNADKRRAVTLLLNDEEWQQWSDREIARRCGVSNHFACDMRAEMTVNGSQSPNIRKGADGRSIDTSNIGKKAAEPKSLNALVKYQGGTLDQGAFDRAVDITHKLKQAGLWYGEEEIWIDHPYQMHTALFGPRRVSLDSLIWVRNKDMSLAVTLPPELYDPPLADAPAEQVPADVLARQNELSAKQAARTGGEAAVQVATGPALGPDQAAYCWKCKCAHQNWTSVGNDTIRCERCGLVVNEYIFGINTRKVDPPPADPQPFTDSNQPADPQSAPAPSWRQMSNTGDHKDTPWGWEAKAGLGGNGHKTTTLEALHSSDSVEWYTLFQRKRTKPMPPIILEREEVVIVSAATLERIGDPLAALIADAVAFADEKIQRSDLENGLQAFILAVYEMQEDCPTCGGLGLFLKADQRCTWKCRDCGGKGWRWSAALPSEGI